MPSEAIDCIRTGLRGSEFYSMIKFFDGEETLAAVTVVIATVLAPITVYLGRRHLQALDSLNDVPLREKRWYLVLAGFPAVAAIQAWLNIVIPALGIAFEVVYITYEAFCLACFAYLLLRLSPEPFERFLDHLDVRDFFSEAMSRSGHCDANSSDDPTAHLRYRIKFVYQMLVFAPIFAFLKVICEYAGGSSADDLYPLFAIGLLFSTVTAAFNIILMWCCILEKLPEPAKIHRKFFTVKGMVFVSNIQMIIVGLVMACGGYGDVLYKTSVAQNVWSSLIFLVELPALQLFFQWAYPVSDFKTLFSGQQIQDPLLWQEEGGAGTGAKIQQPRISLT